MDPTQTSNEGSPRGLFALLLRRRNWFLLGVLALLGGLLVALPRIRFDNSVESFFLEGDETLAIYDTFKDRFQSDEYVLISLESPERWTPGYVEELRSLVARLEKIPHVLEVTAITNVRYIEGVEDELIVGDFLSEDHDTDEKLARRRATALTHPYYRDLYVSADGKHIGVVVKTEIIEGQIDHKVELTRKTRELLRETPYAGWHGRAVGAPLLDADVRVIVTQESALFGLLCFAIVALGFALVFRSVLGVVLPITIAGLSIAGTFGIMALIDAPVGLLTPIIPSFMISVGVGTAVYLITEIYQETAKGVTLGQAILHALRTSGGASFMSVFTTAGGILAFSSSKVAIVAELGIAMGLGLLLSFLLSIVLVPVAFSWFKRVRRSDQRDRMLLARLAAFERLAAWVIRKKATVLLGFAAILVVAIVGALRLKSDFYYLGMFDEGTGIRRDYAVVDRTLKGSASVEILIDTEEDGLKDPELLHQIEGLQEHVNAEFAALGVKTYSLVDVLKEVNQALHGGDPAFYRIPDTRNEVAQYLVLYTFSENNDLADLVTGNYNHGRIRIGIKNLAYSEYAALFAAIRDYLAAHVGAKAQLIASAGAATPAAAPAPAVEITGLVHLWEKINGYIYWSQVQALAITTLVVMAIMMLMLRSVRLGLAMTVANGAAIVVTLGVMGWAGIALDPYTLLIASIALGMLDDDTIHFVRRIQWERQQGATLREAVKTAMGSAGQAMIYMAIVLALGFATYGFSDVASLRKFGLLISFTIAVGSFMEFLLVPALLIHFEGVLFGRARAEV